MMTGGNLLLRPTAAAGADDDESLVNSEDYDTDLDTEGHLRYHTIPYHTIMKKGKGSPYSITERRVPELIPFLGSQPAGDVSHKLGGRMPLLSARPAVTLATLKRAATIFAAR